MNYWRTPASRPDASWHEQPKYRDTRILAPHLLASLMPSISFTHARAHDITLQVRVYMPFRISIVPIEVAGKRSIPADPSAWLQWNYQSRNAYGPSSMPTRFEQVGLGVDATCIEKHKRTPGLDRLSECGNARHFR